jgi:thioredoxin-related protein
MKRIPFIVIFFLVIAQSHAQENTVANDELGIHFVQKLDWKSLQAKARAENKYIFVDCYATWCGPCKKMDAEVYPDEKLRPLMNSRFISLKVQMDETNKDPEDVKKWYAQAKAMQNEFKVTAFPTFLFFAPDGRILHKDLGYKSVDAFITMARDATDPSKQYYSLLDRYNQGMLPPEQLRTLALTAKRFGYNNEALSIATEYKKKFLDPLSTEELCTKANLEFINSFPQFINDEGSKGKWFTLFYAQPQKVNAVSGMNDFAGFYVSNIIRKEEITDRLWKGGKAINSKPDWKKIEKTISKKYGAKYVKALVPAAQIEFYKMTKDWITYANLLDNALKENPPTHGQKKFSEVVGGLASYGDDAWGLNVAAWDLFLYCADKKALEKALTWSDLSIELEKQANGAEKVNVQFLDTKANILYRLGRIEEAIALESEALKRVNSVGPFGTEYAGIIQKMKKGEATWKE